MTKEQRLAALEAEIARVSALCADPSMRTRPPERQAELRAALSSACYAYERCWASAGGGSELKKPDWLSEADLVRAANGLDGVVVETRQLAERCRNGSHEGDEAASERYRFGTSCANVAAWLRKLVRDAEPGR